MPTPIIRSNPTTRSAEHKESKPHHPSRRLCRPLLGRSDVRLSVGDLGWTAEFPLGGDISPRRFPGAVERDSIFPRRPHFGNPHRNLRCRRRQRGRVLLCRGDFNANCHGVAICSLVARERPALRVCMWTCLIVLLTEPSVPIAMVALHRGSEVILGALLGGAFHFAAEVALSALTHASGEPPLTDKTARQNGNSISTCSSEPSRPQHRRIE